MQRPSNACCISVQIDQHLSCVTSAAPQAQVGAGHSHMTSYMIIQRRASNDMASL
jgi:hypothetical protein